jgi:ATP-dependent Clp protease ATP-binding subunit ClpC
MEEELHKRHRPDAAIIAVSKSIRRARAGIRDPAPDGLIHLPRPLRRREDGARRTLAEFLFGDEDAMIRSTCRSTWRSTPCPGSSLASRPIGYDEAAS